MGEFEPFHSAVNRIPVLRQPSHAMADKDLLPKDLFSDGPATGHDHLAADRWSGSIDLEMTVHTPLVFGEQKDGEISLPIVDGKLVVPPTMVKGMISRAFEILTCSRFRVFGAVENTSGLRKSKNDHSQRLTYRPTAKSKRRRRYKKSPQDLATAQDVLPLTKGAEASAADRVLGYVIPEPRAVTALGDIASRGHISFGVVDTSDVKIKEGSKQLAPLMSPKPSSARRFLTDNVTGGTPTKNGLPLARHDLFSDGQALGVAAYPVHRTLLDKPGSSILASKSANSSKNNKTNRDSGEANKNVRQSFQSWIETGSSLRCTMRFTNLSESELGALIWVLTPENLVPVEEKQKDPSAIGFLRMGVGKPLGLGAIETRIAANGLHATSGSTLAKDYMDLAGCLGTKTPDASPKDFTLPIEADPLKTLRVKAMQRAAFGYSDGVEIRYMTLNENKNNNQSDPKTGKPEANRGLSPVDLFAEPPEPIRIKPPRKQSPKKKRRSTR